MAKPYTTERGKHSMSKKCLSLILVLSMIMQLVCMIPAMAAETTEIDATSIIRTIYENDFESDIDGWAVGETKAKEVTYNLSHETYEDKGVLALSSTATISNSYCYQPTAFLDFADIEFTSGNKIVIEMSLKQSGDNADGRAWSYLKYNRPNKSDLTNTNAAGNAFHVAATPEDAANWWTMLSFRADQYASDNGDGTTTTKGADSVYYMKSVNSAPTYTKLSDVDTTAEWTDVKIVIDEGTKKYSVEATAGGQTYSANDGLIKANDYEINNSNIAYGTTLTNYDSLDNLTLYLREQAQTLYVDSFKVYEIIPAFSATAYLTDGILFDPTDAVKVTFVSDGAIAEIPEGAVAINGVTAIESYDAATKTLTLTPDTNLTAGAEYTVTFDEAALESIGMLYNGNALNFKVKGYGVNYFINDDFNTDGNIGAWKLVYGTESGKNITLKQTTLTDGTGVMELGADRYSSETTTSLPTISNDFKDISFSQADEIVIETRFMATGGVKSDGTEGNTTYLKFNQPEDKSLAGITPPSNGGGYLGSQGGTLIQATATAVSYKKTNGYTVASANDNLVGGEWINAKIVLRPNEGVYGMYTITTWEDGDEENAVTKTDGVLQENSLAFYDPQAYKDNGNSIEGLTVTKHTALKNLLFAIRQFSNTMYVDYIKGYTELGPDKEITGASLASNLIAKDASPALVLETEDDLDTTIAGAFAIDGVDAAVSYDAATKTVTFTPDVAFEMGKTYTVTVDSDMLYNAGVDYTGAETFNFKVMGYGKNYFVDDNFDTDLGEWTLGIHSDKNTGSLTWDENGYMVLVCDESNGASFLKDEIRAEREFDDIAIAGNKIVVEARMKATGDSDGLGSAYLRFNAPFEESRLGYSDNWNWTGWAGGVLADLYTGRVVNGENVKAPSIRYKKNSYGTDTVISGIGGNDIWVNVKAVIDGTNGNTQSYTLTAWADNDEANSVTKTGVLNEFKPHMYDLAFDASSTMHTMFKNLSFGTYMMANTVTVDYVKVYTEVTPDVKMSAAVASGLIDKDAPVVINVESESDITVLPNGAFAIDGVTVAESYDAATKTLTLTTAEGWAEGTAYTINVDKDALYAAGIDYTGAEVLTFKTLGAGTNYFLEDDFNTEGDIGNWKLVYGTEGGKNITLKQTTLTDGTGVMEFGADRYSSAATTSSPTISNDFADIELDTNNIVIETRFMSVGGGTKADGTVGALSYFKFNQPEDKSLAGYSQAGGYLGAQGGTLVQFGHAGTYYKSGSYSTSVHDASLTSGKWINAKIVIDNTDGTKSDYTLTTWEDGNEAGAKSVTGTMNENGNYYYNPVLFKDEDTTNDQTRHLTLQNLLFVIREYSDTVYVDYVKAAIVRDFKVNATINCGPSVEVGKPIEVKFNSDVALNSIPADAVAIAGVETTNTYDAATQTITVPTTALTEGETYTLTVDKAKLEAAVNGLSLTGVQSFNIRARGEREKGRVISDNFNDGKASGWTIGAANDGYKAGLDFVDVEGEEGNKALKVTMSAIKAGNGNQPNITRVLGNGIELKNGEWVTIKTRIKRSEGFNYFLKANRPDTIEQVLHEYEWATYTLMGASAKVCTVTSTGALGGVEGAYTYYPADPNGADIPDEWVTYTITFKPETGCYWISAALDDGTVITNERVGAIYVAGTAVEKMFGTAPASNQSYKFLDSLTFIPMADNTGELLIDYINVSVKNTNVIAEAALTVDGEEVEEITAGTTVKPVFTINPEEGVTEYTVISALYIDGIMQDTHINPIDVTEAGTEYTEADGWVIPSALEGRYEIKAFVWDTLGGMKPVSTVTSAQSAAND